MNQPMRVLIFGLGYTGLRLAQTLAGAGVAVAGTVREPARYAHLAEHGITPIPFAAAGEALAGVTHILSSVPPGDGGDPVLLAHLPALQAAPALRWAGYLSTTGVYGDHGGGWVDESSPTNPSSPRAHWRLAAEQAWQASGLPVAVFRLPGIYGPGRSVFDQLANGTARRIDRPGHVFSRIHVDDIVGAVQAAMARPTALGVFNLVDDLAAEPRAVTEFACDVLAITPPPLTSFDPAALTPMARSFWADSKRVSNARMKAELGYALRYPDYRSGLSAIFGTAPG